MIITIYTKSHIYNPHIYGWWNIYIYIHFEIHHRRRSVFYISSSLTHPRSGSELSTVVKLLLERSPLKKFADTEGFGVEGERINCCWSSLLKETSSQGKFRLLADKGEEASLKFMASKELISSVRTSL